MFIGPVTFRMASELDSYNLYGERGRLGVVESHYNNGFTLLTHYCNVPRGQEMLQSDERSHRNLNPYTHP